MELLLLLLGGGGVAVLGAWAVRRRQRRAAGAKPNRNARPELGAKPDVPVPRDLEQLLPKDVLSLDGVDWIVMRVARYHEQDRGWIEGQLLDGQVEAWIVVGTGFQGTVHVGARVADLVCEGAQPSEALDHRGTIFSLEREGQATVQWTGAPAPGFTTGPVRYWEYGRPGADRVWLRRAGERWHGFHGRRLPRHLVTFIPGS